ncbi:MAG: hypothetical protein ACYC6P_14525 [Ignavibacteriaceae bacterium]
MKNILMIMSLSLFCVGCSSYYTAKDFSSKEKYYKDFNDFAKNKNMTVTLINDSSFTTYVGSEILNDTLSFLREKDFTHEEIPLKNIKSINYNRHWLGHYSWIFCGNSFGCYFSSNQNYTNICG